MAAFGVLGCHGADFGHKSSEALPYYLEAPALGQLLGGSSLSAAHLLRQLALKNGRCLPDCRRLLIPAPRRAGPTGLGQPPGEERKSRSVRLGFCPAMANNHLVGTLPGVEPAERLGRKGERHPDPQKIPTWVNQNCGQVSGNYSYRAGRYYQFGGCVTLHWEQGNRSRGLPRFSRRRTAKMALSPSAC